MDARVTQPDGQLDMSLVDEVEEKTAHLLSEAKQLTGGTGDEAAISRDIRRKLEAILQLPALESRYATTRSSKYKSAANYLSETLHDDPVTWGGVLSWLFVHSLGKILTEVDYEGQSRSWIDEWLLGKIITGVLRDLGLDDVRAWHTVTVVKLLTTHQRWFEKQVSEKTPAYQTLESWLRDSEVQGFLQVNRYQDVLWFNQEAFEQLLWWMLLVATIGLNAEPDRSTTEMTEEIVQCYDIIQQLRQAEQQSEYQVEKLLAALEA